MAKGVWADVLGDAGAGGIHFDIVEDCDAREVAAAAVAQEYVVLLARFRRDVSAVVKPSVGALCLAGQLDRADPAAGRCRRDVRAGS